MTAPEIADQDHRRLLRHAFQLEYATIAWNTLEGVVAIVAGLSAGSVALVAFGLDSSVEVFASIVVVLELRGADRSGEHRAVRLIGVGYLLVGVYVAWDTITSIASGHRPDASPLGIAFLAVTVVVMLLLAAGKLRVGRAIASPTVLADGRFSLVDGALAGSVLVGLVLTAILGWWWADAVLAGVIAVFALREGAEAWRRHDRQASAER
ncbi:MAG TPA: cation transporter [Candidatus Limnocylindrales bacterium]|jgi:divalent metal cation (Fe/Co/Zn/Cd) transporter